MSKKRLLTLEKQKHLYESLVNVFKDQNEEEIQEILQTLGLEEFIEGSGVYSLNIKSSAPVYIVDNYNITLSAVLYSYFADITNQITSWQWERNSGNVAEDNLWKVDKTNPILNLTVADFPRLDSTDITFKLKVVINNITVEDTITFTKFLQYSKLQIVPKNGTIFLDDSPNTLDFETTVTGFNPCNGCYKWYLNEDLIGINTTVTIPYDIIEPRSVNVLKVTTESNNGDEYEDYISIARISNGQNASTPYTLDLSNDSIMIPANLDGSITGSTAYYSAVTEATLYLGNDIINISEYEIELEASPGITYTATNNNRNVQITGMSTATDTGYIRFKAFVDGVQVSTKLFTINKSKGEPTYQLVVTPNAVKLNERITGNQPRFEPGQIQVSVIINDGTNVTSGNTDNVKYRYLYHAEDEPGDADYTLSSNGIVNLLDEVEELESIPSIGVQFRLFHPVTNRLCDSETVPIIKDGTPGMGTELRYLAFNDGVNPPSFDNTEDEPEGWTTTIPALSGSNIYLWMISGIKYSDNGQLVGVWSNPVRITGPQGPPGTIGSSGITVTTDNPLQALPVGSDAILNLEKIFRIRFTAYSGSLELIAVANENDLSDGEYWIGFPSTVSHPGITLSRPQNSLVDVKIAAGTNFLDTDSVNIVFPVKVMLNGEISIVNTSFVITPIKTAEDSLGLSLISNTSVVQCDNSNTVTYPSEILLTALQQGYNETITWQAYTNGNILDNTILVGSPSTNYRTISIQNFNLNPALKSVRIKISTPNGLFDEVSIVRVTDGNQGPQGINGTTGPIPRLFEWSNGAYYQADSRYKDYVYYRPEGEMRGWWTVKINPGETLQTIETLGGKIAGATPISNANFFKEPFENLGTFGTIVAEQANIGGFIIRNQILESQQRINYINSCAGTTINTPQLTVNGLLGFIQFSERMVLNYQGITLKDDCGRPRIQMHWTGDGVPILRFLAEDGSTTWQAGQNGYVSYIISRQDEYIGVKMVVLNTALNETPTAASIPNIQIGGRFCKCYGNNYGDLQKYLQNDIENAGYEYSRGTEDVATTIRSPEDNGRIYVGDSHYSNPIADKWYIKDISSESNPMGGEYINRAVFEVAKIINGKVVETIYISKEFTSLQPCGTHGFYECQ